MKRNFAARTETTLSLQGRDYDLHNDFLLEKLQLSLSENSVEIIFRSRDISESSRLVITFLDVSVFRAIGFDVQMPLSERACMDSYGFLHPDDLSVMNGFLPESFATVAHHIIFLFRDGFAIKLFAKEAVAVFRTHS